MNPWRASQASILGIVAANALGAIILAAPSRFEVITWCGVGYLAWLGFNALRAAFQAGAPRRAPSLEARPMEYPVLLGYSLLAAAGSVATSTLRNR